MKKTLLALSITSALSTVSFANLAADQKKHNDPIENIVVTANRTTQDKFDVLASTAVFSRDDIERIQPLSVADLLTRVAGVTIAKTGGIAQQSSVFVRGSSSGHLLVLVNGVRVGSATLGSKDLSSIQVQLIERIEIVKGPRAALWGSDAMGGVLQIFTRKLTAGEKQIGVKYGSNNHKQGYGAIGLGNEQHNYTISGNVESSTGFDVIKPNPNSWTVNQPDKDGFHRQSFALVGNSQFNHVFSIETNAQLDKGVTEIDNAWGGDEITLNNHNLLVRGHLNYDTSQYQLSIANSKDYNKDNNKEKQAAFNPNATNNLFKTVRNQISATANYNLYEQGELLIGVEHYKEKVTGSIDYTQNERTANAFFITTRQQVQQLKLEASIRRDSISALKSKVTYQLGVGYDISDNFLIAINHGTAFKAPTFNELYYPFSGNPDLKPETAKNTELLTRYQNNRYSIETSIFRSNYNNMIIWEPDISGLWRPLNASPLIKGIETNISYNIFEFKNTLTFSHIDAQNDQIHKQLLRIPYFSANYNIDYQGDNWSIGLDLNYQGGRYDIDGSQRIRLASNTVINLNASYEITPKLSLFAKIANLNNRKYQQINEHPADNRNVSLTLDYKF